MNVSSAKYASKSHRDKAVINQDYVIARNINDKVSVAVLSDGAGSKRYGGATAEYIVKCVEKYCLDNANREDLDECIKKELFSVVNDGLISLVHNSGEVIEHYGATMLFVIICNHKYIAGHIGDGVILYRGGSSFCVLSKPDNGEYINQTYFLPTKTQQEHFRVYEGKVEKKFCFILASDGLSGTLYDQVESKISNACEQMYLWCKFYDHEKCEKILEENLVEVFDKYTDDDKSIAIICDSAIE